jgi:hypothetical protein
VHPQKRTTIWINAVGGAAVLGSYAHGLWSHPTAGADLWGGVPETLRPLYTITMLLAAAGYFAFSHFVIFEVDPDEARIGDRFGFGAFNALYVLILVPSALWMPLTFEMLASPGTGLWWAIRLTLGAVGVGSLGLLASIIAVRPVSAPGARRLALFGSAAFCLQTAVLDALVWPAFFPI